MATMGEAASAKTCGICGEDCSGKPRIKDKAGKYFCKTCHDAAAKRQGAPVTNGASRAAAYQPDDQYGMLDSLVSEQIAAPPIASNHCSNCGTLMAPGAAICVSCGFNPQSGAATKVRVHKAPRPPRLGGWLGPIILGGGLALASVIGGFALFGTEVGFGLFGFGFLFGLISFQLWTIFDARSIPGAQFKVWVVPFYSFVHIYGQSESRYLRTFVPGLAAVVVTFFILGAEHERHPPKSRSNGTVMQISKPRPEDIHVVPQPVNPGDEAAKNIAWPPERSNSPAAEKKP